MDDVISKGERTRAAILDAAYDLFIEQGFAATSMRDIAGRAGLAPGSLYNHFSSKEEIFAAIIELRHPFYRIMPILKGIQGNTIEEFVRNAAHTLVEQLGSYPEVLNLLLIEIVEFQGIHAPAVFMKFLPELAPLAERMQGMGGQIRQIPPFVLLRAFVGLFFSYYITGVLVGRAMPAEMQSDALDHFVDIFLHGLLLKETQ
jgi:AcrR family transcriptional regulator